MNCTNITQIDVALFLCERRGWLEVVMLGWDCGAVNLGWPFYLMLGVFGVLMFGVCAGLLFHFGYLCVKCAIARKTEMWDVKANKFVELKELKSMH